MELNSIEAMQFNQDWALLCLTFGSKELQMGVLHCAPIEGLSSSGLIFNPNRYRSKAAEAFSRKFYKFATTGWSKEGRHRYKQML